MDGKKYLIVSAGGTGTRMGSALPKQFLLLGGVPILRRTIEVFLSAIPDIQVVTVLPEAHVDYWRDYCIRENFFCPQRLVKGGFTRFHSVKNALKHVPADAVVAVHDGVRPLVTPGKIRELFAAAQDAPAVIPVLPVTDTLKVIDRKDGKLVSAGTQIDRSRIFGAQTPQVFQAASLKAAYGQQFDTLFTDDASVAERYGIPLTFVEGERFNLKITTPEDLILAKAILEASRVPCTSSI